MVMAHCRYSVTCTKTIYNGQRDCSPHGNDGRALRTARPASRGTPLYYNTRMAARLRNGAPFECSVQAFALQEAPHEHKDDHQDMDTIAAIVSGNNPSSAVSIIRLSGRDAVGIAECVFSPAGKQPWTPESHRVYYGHAIEMEETSVKVIDEVLVIVMLGPRSYTAEDVVEIHTHGGVVCARRVLASCMAAGARLARPGEFTLRAFLNGRLDLSQAESVASLVSARTTAAADSALAGIQGGVGQHVLAARKECLDILSELEARLDFEEDLPPLDSVKLILRIEKVAALVKQALDTSKHGRMLRDGMQVALVGRPNVGKSSLLNALSGVNKAIVTDIAGTTRDIVESGIDIHGIPVTLLDTAGLRDSVDKVEQLGVERSLAAAKDADIVLMVVDGEKGREDEDSAILERLQGQNEVYKTPTLLVINKSDVDGSNQRHCCHIPGKQDGFVAVVRTSALTGQGLHELRCAMLSAVGVIKETSGAVSGLGWAVNERQTEALTKASQALGALQSSMAQELPLDFWTIDLRAALIALGEVSGDEVTEEVLDSIFARFCIGK